FKVEAVEQTSIERTPRCRTEIKIPIHVFFGGLGFRREPTAHDGLQSRRMGVKGVQWAEFAKARQANREQEIRQTAPLGAGLEHAPGAAEYVAQREALGDVLRTRLLAIDVFARLGR